MDDPRRRRRQHPSRAPDPGNGFGFRDIERSKHEQYGRGGGEQLILKLPGQGVREVVLSDLLEGR